jgi:hypothetical protein
VKSVLGKVAGPVLAAGASALGFPAAAPFLVQYGSKAVDAVTGIMSEAASSSSGSSATSSTGSSTSTTTSGTDGNKDKLAMMQIERLMETQKEMFSMVSNVL